MGEKDRRGTKKNHLSYAPTGNLGIERNNPRKTLGTKDKGLET